jgi:hypothetical protein
MMSFIKNPVEKRKDGEEMKKVGFVGLMVAGLMMFALFTANNQAQATLISCLSGSTCDVDLTNSNIANLNGNIDIRVTIDNTGLDTLLKVNYISAGVTDTPLGIDMFGFNGIDASINGVSSCPAGWTCSFMNPQNMDGFGGFQQFEKSPASTDLAMNFGLSSLVTSFPDNGGSNDSNFALHLRFDDCSGFVSNGTSNDSTGKGCTLSSTPPSVPEPSSLILLGSGLAGFAVWGRKRLKRIAS